ncbi:MAG: hypothetical protein UV10_C0035G0002 [Candidatus Azambacteria bacterium GW2011_GWA1_42_19]|uniref:DUF4157 domain-containing protein n=1 Tax=Candidatus Azambacteria bacterium GW2011_GWA1_42_19 TaxID=1618609 RepID=A0A0G1C5Z2_9BACT|nr:MAG: hypothetical protein UV10_C0035G0002 [Candidatus Azambacteria bacterium GW2011_GWA1_42_19]
MTLDSNIKVKPKFWNLIPWISEQTATALYPNIYLPEKTYRNLQKTNPDPYNIARLIHEQTHIKRIQKEGVVKFALKYLLDPTYRISEELIATKESMKFIKSKKLIWNIDRSARFLSGWLYLWPDSYKNIKSKLDRIWYEI